MEKEKVGRNMKRQTLSDMEYSCRNKKTKRECQFGYRKTRYRGLRKNETRLSAMSACANLYLLAVAGRRLREA